MSYSYRFGARLHLASESLRALMTFETNLPLQRMESLENGVATHFGVTSLWSVRALLQASSQR